MVLNPINSGASSHSSLSESVPETKANTLAQKVSKSLSSILSRRKDSKENVKETKVSFPHAKQTTDSELVVQNALKSVSSEIKRSTLSRQKGLKNLLALENPLSENEVSSRQVTHRSESDSNTSSEFYTDMPSKKDWQDETGDLEDFYGDPNISEIPKKTGSSDADTDYVPMPKK